MFKKLVKIIIASDNFSEAFGQVDTAFQHEKISWDDHQTLLSLCEKIFN